MFKGGRHWLSGDVIAEIADLVEQGNTVTQALRIRLGLPERDPRKPQLEEIVRPYDVSMLEIGEELFFSDAAQAKVAPHIRRQIQGTQRVYQLNMTDKGVQVIRTK